MLRIRPAEGVILRHPVTRDIVPADGIVIPSDDPNLSYWLRRQTDGDAVVTPENED